MNQQQVTVPAQGTASGCGCGNAQQSYQVHEGRENYSYRMPAGGAMGGNYLGVAGGGINGGQSCQIAPPPAKRVYCSPSPFSPVVPGMTYQPLLQAYGQSKPAYY